MSRHPNGADETSSASGPLNNPLASSTTQNEEKMKSDLGPLQPEASSEDGATSPDHPAGDPNDPAADSNIAATSASIALNDDNNHNQGNNFALQLNAADTTTTADSSATSPQSVGGGSAMQQQQQQQHPHNSGEDSPFGGDGGGGGALPQEENATATTSSSSSSANASVVTPKGSSNSNVNPNDDDDGTDQEVPVSNDANSSVTWKPQDKQSVCEFTHIIADYSQKRDSGCKKAEYSDITVDDCGNKWRLIVYVNGNGRASNHHLSLFLQVRFERNMSLRPWTGEFFDPFKLLLERDF